MKFSLIIPCYNESANLPLLLERCKLLGAQPILKSSWLIMAQLDRSPEVLQNLLPQYRVAAVCA
jgi:hypothetical protein